MPLGRVPGENAANASLVVRVCEHGKKGGRGRTGNPPSTGSSPT